MEHHHAVDWVAERAPEPSPPPEDCSGAPVPRNERERLAALRGYEVLDTAREPAFDELTQQAARACGTPIALISLVDETRQWFKSGHGLEVRETRREVAFCAHALLGEGLFVIPDATADARFRDNPLVTGSFGLRFYAGAPLITPEGFTLGTLCVIDVCPRQLGAEQARWLEFLARQVMHLLEARRVRQERARLAEALRRSEQHLELLRGAVHEGVWEWDPAARRVTCNARVAELWGHPGGGEQEDRLWFERIHPEDREPVAASFRRAIESDEPSWAHEHRVRRADGSWARVSNRGSLLRGADGVLLRFIGTVVDVSEREELRARLTLSERMASVGTLAAGVAHELNNPLAYVLANLDFARGELEDTGGGGPKDAAVLGQVLAEAHEGAERMRHIVRDLKLFSRPDEARLEWVELPRALDSAAAMAWNEIRHRARLVKDYGAVPAVHANEARLGQVFLNLLVNAAHAIPEGAASAHEIRLVTRVDGAGQVLIEVHDTGGGIPEALRGRILEPFFTTKPLGMGTGLGLSISQDIVRSLGGRLEFDSEVGRGTVFRVVLPAPRPREVTRAEDGQPARTARRGHVVVVDDEPRMLSALQRALGSSHDVTVFSGARAALAWLAEERPWDLLLCDVMMPEMTGMELYTELARRSPERARHVVFLTGGAFTERTREFLAEVPNARLEKPFNFQRLRELLDARLGTD